MKKAEFRVLLLAASFEATRFAQRYVFDALPFTFRYAVHLNQSGDSKAGDDAILYPQDDGRVLAIDSEEGVVDLLWRDHHCPEWIDISVRACTPTFTVLQLLCCGRYASERERLYYEARGFGPFGVKSPALPANWREGSRFKLQGA